MDQVSLMLWALNQIQGAPMPRVHDRLKDQTAYYEERCGDEGCAHEWQQHDKDTGACAVDGCPCTGWE